jgi:hypothetical protein
VAVQQGALPFIESPADVGEIARELLRPHNAAMAELVEEARAAYNKESWCGGYGGIRELRVRVFEEWAQTVYDLIGLLAAILVVVTLYRVYALLHSVCNRRPVDDVRMLAVLQVVEIATDVVYLLKALVVCLSIRGLVTLPSDLLSHLCAEPSCAVLRQVIDHHFVNIMSDLMRLFIDLFTLLCTWDAIRFALATALFGAFAPMIVLESAFVKWADEGPTATTPDTSARHTNNTMCSWHTVMIFVPHDPLDVRRPHFLWVLCGGTQRAGRADRVLQRHAGDVCLQRVQAFRHRDPRVIQLRRGIVREVKPTWHNLLAHLTVLWDGLLLIALAVSATSEKTLY